MMTTTWTTASNGVRRRRDREALVEAFFRRDYRVVATARDIAPTDHPHVLVIPDVIDDDLLAEQLLVKTLVTFGRIDTLVDNAGASFLKLFAEITAAEFRQVVSTNLGGFFHVTRHGLVAVAKQGSGHIVSVTTLLAEVGNSRSPAAGTALTKGAINSATRSLAIECADRGVRPSAVPLSLIETGRHPPDTREAKRKPPSARPRSRTWWRPCSTTRTPAS